MSVAFAPNTWLINSVRLRDAHLGVRYAAGGLVGHFDGSPGFPESGDILAGGEKIFQALAEEFKPL